MANALLLVDFQNDFCEGGSLAVAGGKAAATALRDMLVSGGFEQFDYIITSQDWHIEPGEHFSDNPDFKNSWPPHCRAGHEGAAIVKELEEILAGRPVIRVKKGQYEAAYSAFEGITEAGENLADLLHQLGVTELFVVGIAGNYCVFKSVIDGRAHGFEIRVLTAYVASIDNGTVEDAFAAMIEAGARIV